MNTAAVLHPTLLGELLKIIWREPRSLQRESIVISPARPLNVVSSHEPRAAFASLVEAHANVSFHLTLHPAVVLRMAIACIFAQQPTLTWHL